MTATSPTAIDLEHIDQYDYELPRGLVAQHPLANREDARLMVVDRRTGQIDHWHVRDLPELLAAGDALVVNDTRVMPAALVGRRRSTGGRWRGLYLESDPSGVWHVLGKTRGKIRSGEIVALEDREGREAIELELLARLADGGWAARPRSDRVASEILDQVGRVPLPHYIRGGQMVDADVASYQTVFARESGSVAAPTAGLHFTPRLVGRLRERAIAVVPITLHVGLGTFRPITHDHIGQHAMHSEWGSISASVAEALNETRRRGGRVIAVGSTAARVLETAAAGGEIRPWSGQTNLYIRPGFRFAAVDALLTNFHLPRTTLLVLVRTFGGDALMRTAYATAIDQQYRFYSYGDAMLIL
jgi:S-adenosylmethionine:tRNA ribosyltransferase-isomerase